MSDNYLRIIPVDPHRTPPKDVAQRAVELVGPRFPEADEVVAKSYGHPIFIDQGANLEAIICPACAARLAFYSPDKAGAARAWWYGVTDPLEEHSVMDVVVAMTCCRAQVPFCDLRYDWPAGVASFEISVMNPGVSEPLIPEQQADLEMILGCGMGNGDAGRRLTAAVGDTIEVTLQTIGPGHYGSPVLSSGSVVFLGESSAGPPIPAGPTQLYRFEAASGLADITIAHTGDPREGPAIPPFVLTVGVP